MLTKVEIYNHLCKYMTSKNTTEILLDDFCRLSSHLDDVNNIQFVCLGYGEKTEVVSSNIDKDFVTVYYTIKNN